MSRVSIGVAGALGPQLIAEVAVAVEGAGFHALWVNDTPEGDALAALAAAARSTQTLMLATGVVPLDRRPAEEIVRETRGLPDERLVLGVGSGRASAGALELVRSGVELLKRETRAEVLVGALGPRMRRLAATAADGPLLSWLTPDAASEHAGAAHRAGPDAHVALYVRTAFDPAARARLDAETARYAEVPNYAANFARLGIDAHDTVIGPGGSDVIGRYRAVVDEVVLRAITPGDGLDDYRRFIETAAAQLSR